MSGPFITMRRQRYGVRRLVLKRAIEECVALGGHGIVGLALTISPFPAGGAATITRPKLQSWEPR